MDDALNKCGTWDAFHWLMLFYCGMSWMCDVSSWGVEGGGVPRHCLSAQTSLAAAVLGRQVGGNGCVLNNSSLSTN